MMAVLEFKTFGEIEAAAVSDGIFHTSYDRLRNIDHDKAVQLVGRAGTGASAVHIQVNAFVVKFGGRLILVDAGSGSTLGPTLGKLADNLRLGGIEPSAITHVLLTHLHPDHVNGLVDEADRPIYPNAEILVHEDDARFYFDRAVDARDADFARRSSSAARRVLTPYLQQLRRIKDGEALPGISAHLQAGHSPGHTGWLMQSGRATVLFWGDIVHIGSIQFAHPEVTSTFDLDQNAAADARRRVFDWTATDRIAVAGAHLDLPGFGYVARRGTGYAFEQG